MTEADRLAAYRVALAFGQRNAQMWALWKFRKMSHAEIGQQFEVTRARAQQICARAELIARNWPAANAWHETLPLRLRELCRLNRYAGAGDLAHALTSGRVPVHFEATDLLAARNALGLSSGTEADETIAALGRVAYALELMRLDIDALCEEGVIGSRVLRRAATVLQRHGKAVFLELQRDAAAISATAGAASLKGIEP